MPRNELRVTSPLIFDTTEQDFNENVLQASAHTPVLVDFWAEWCPPCRSLTPVLEKVVRAGGGKVRLAKVDADENMKLAGRYQLRGFPTVILFVNGEEVGRFASFRPENFVREFIDSHLPASVAGRHAGA
jgi:putative thioredoxin